MTEESRDGFEARTEEVEARDGGASGLQLKVSGRSYRFVPVGEYRSASKLIASLLTP